ncbi:MAG: PDZ domain-containing protein [Planctomycetota bacterium]
MSTGKAMSDLAGKGLAALIGAAFIAAAGQALALDIKSDVKSDDDTKKTTTIAVGQACDQPDASDRSVITFINNGHTFQLINDSDSGESLMVDGKPITRGQLAERFPGVKLPTVTSAPVAVGVPAAPGQSSWPAVASSVAPAALPGLRAPATVGQPEVAVGFAVPSPASAPQPAAAPRPTAVSAFPYVATTSSESRGLVEWADAPPAAVNVFGDGEFFFAQPGDDAPRVVIGVTLGEADEKLLHHLGQKGDMVLVESVIDGMPAKKAGIKKYDIIIEVEGDKVRKLGDLRKILSDRDPGDEVEVIVLRGGDKKKVKVELEPYGERVGSAPGGGRVFVAPRDGETREFRFSNRNGDRGAFAFNAPQWQNSFKFSEDMQEGLRSALEGLKRSRASLDKDAMGAEAFAEAASALESAMVDLQSQLEDLEIKLNVEVDGEQIIIDGDNLLRLRGNVAPQATGGIRGMTILREGGPAVVEERAREAERGAIWVERDAREVEARARTAERRAREVEARARSTERGARELEAQARIERRQAEMLERQVAEARSQMQRRKGELEKIASELRQRELAEAQGFQEIIERQARGSAMSEARLEKLEAMMEARFDAYEDRLEAMTDRLESRMEAMMARLERAMARAADRRERDRDE